MDRPKFIGPFCKVELKIQTFSKHRFYKHFLGCQENVKKHHQKGKTYAMQQPVFSSNSGYLNKYFDWMLRTVIFKTFYDLTIELSINQLNKKSVWICLYERVNLFV